MIPATEEDLKNIQRDFDEFRRLGDTDLKAAYLAISGRGFDEIVKTGDTTDSIMMHRAEDDKFVICSFPLKEAVRPVISSILPRIVRFHVDEGVMNENKEKA
jgi:hypothetical protein